jgi:cytoskeletal protein RodZ
MFYGPDNFGHAAPAVFGILATLVSVLFFLVCLAVVVGLLFLLVRFLLVATKAAQLYVAEHEPAKPVEPTVASPVTPTPPVSKPTATRAQTSTTTTRKPRSTPPAV